MPPKRQEKNWDYRVEMRPEDFQPFIQKLDLINRLIARSVQSIEADFKDRVNEALREPHELRIAKLLTAPKIPDRVVALTYVYVRNPNVTAVVLTRANGTCEGCKKPAPFIRRSDGTPYLEVHHKIRLADGGEDTVENAVALCPNCHRLSHFG